MNAVLRAPRWLSNALAIAEPAEHGMENQPFKPASKLRPGAIAAGRPIALAAPSPAPKGACTAR